MPEMPAQEVATAEPGAPDVTNDDREFWLQKRHALIIELDAIEERYLPDKRAETLAAREWLKAQKRNRVESTRV